MIENKVIWKYKLDTGHKTETVLRIPEGAKVLHVGLQNRDLYIWFEVDKVCPREEIRTFYTMHTGSVFDNKDLQFIQTVICNPLYVVHLYEKKENFLTSDDMRL